MHARVLQIILLLALGLGQYGLAQAKDDAKDIFDNVCSVCHNDAINPLDDVHHTRQEWDDILHRMITNNGAPFQEGKIPDLINFLLKDHGPK